MFCYFSFRKSKSPIQAHLVGFWQSSLMLHSSTRDCITISKEHFPVPKSDDTLQLQADYRLGIYNLHIPVSLQCKTILTAQVGERPNCNQRKIWVIGRLGLQSTPEHATEVWMQLYGPQNIEKSSEVTTRKSDKFLLCMRNLVLFGEHIFIPISQAVHAVLSELQTELLET